MKIKKTIKYEWDDEKFVKKREEFSIQYGGRNLLIIDKNPLYKVYYGSMKNKKIERKEVVDNINKDTVLLYLNNFPEFVKKIFKNNIRKQ